MRLGVGGMKRNTIFGMFLLWGIVQIPAAMLVCFICHSSWMVAGGMVFANFLATFLVLYSERKYQNDKIKKAELNVLRAQINPHFLFNTLNTIITYSRTNPETARRLLIRLASFFRHALKRRGHFNSLREEVEYVNNYLVLEKARFGEKLRIQRNIDPGLLDCQVPALTLQPLVENAVKHGIQPKTGAGTVSITVELKKGEILFTIKDDGVGISKDKIQEILLPGSGSGNGIGLSNVHERLKSLFGKNYGLRVVSDENKGTCICFKIPFLISSMGEKGGPTGEAQSVDCR